MTGTKGNSRRGLANPFSLSLSLFRTADRQQAHRGILSRINRILLAIHLLTLAMFFLSDQLFLSLPRPGCSTDRSNDEICFIQFVVLHTKVYTIPKALN